MKDSGFNELKPRGTPEFPFEIYRVDERHMQYVMPYHWHREPELIRVLSGCLYLSLDDTIFTVKAGDVMWVNGGVLHAGGPERCTYECLVFDLDFFARTMGAQSQHLRRLADRSLSVAERLPGDLMRQSCDMIFMEQAGKGDRLRILGGLCSLFSLIFQHGFYRTESSESLPERKNIALLKRLLLYVDAHYAEPVTLDLLAREAGMSPKYFCRFFRSMTNHTPIEYVNICRVERACRMLMEGSAVTETAYACGFGDLSYFIRVFRRRKGVTPGRYAAKKLPGDQSKLT